MSQELAPAERVIRLRRRFGSHDRLAAALREQDASLGATRQRIIGWEKGAGISPRYAAALAALEGSTPEAFRPRQPGPDFRSVQLELRRLDEEVADLRGAVSEIRELLERRPGAVGGSR